MSKDNLGAPDDPSTDRAIPPYPGAVPQHLSRVSRAGPIAATGFINCLDHQPNARLHIRHKDNPEKPEKRTGQARTNAEHKLPATAQSKTGSMRLS